MNKERRKIIAGLIGQLIDARGVIESILADISEVQSEEQEYFDAMPEGIQMGEKGDTASNVVDLLQSVADGADIQDAIDEAIASLEEAAA